MNQTQILLELVKKCNRLTGDRATGVGLTGGLRSHVTIGLLRISVRMRGRQISKHDHNCNIEVCRIQHMLAYGLYIL